MKLKLINLLVWIYQIIIFTIILLIEPVFQIPLLGRTRYFLALINIVIALLIFVLKKKFTINKKTFYYFLSNIVPYIIILIFMIVRSIFDDGISLGSQIKSFSYWLIPMLLMHSAVYLFGHKAIDYTFWAFIVNYSICVILYLAIYKFDGIKNFFYYAGGKLHH